MADDINNSPGFGATDALREAARYSADIANNMSRAAAQVAQMSASLSSMGGGGGGGGGGGLGGGGQSFGLLSGLMAGGKSAAFQGAQMLDAAVGSIFQDIRLKKNETLDIERARLIARGGTGDYKRFTDNLMTAADQYNVQDKMAFANQLASAYNQNWAQGFGGGPGKGYGGLGGERLAAQSLGGLSSLAAAAGLEQGAVTGAMNQMYSSQTYYSAMATGIQTRDARTGNMLGTSEIVNQYAQRFAGQNLSADQIRRALGPGGMFRAELEQTWKDPGLVDMIAEGIIMSAETGQPMTDTGAALGKEAGYFGTEWTQGKDSASHLEQNVLERIATYTNDYTQGLEVINTGLAAFNKGITELPGPLHTLYGSMNVFGGAVDAASAALPNFTAAILAALHGTVGQTVTITMGTAAGALIKAVEGIKSPEQDQMAQGASSANQGLEWGPAPSPSQPASSVEPWVPPPGYTGGTSGNWNPNDWASAVQTGTTAPSTGGGDIALASATGSQTNDQMSLAVMPAGYTSPQTKTGTGPTVNIFVTVQKASDAEAVMLATQVKSILDNDTELERVGSGVLTV